MKEKLIQFNGLPFSIEFKSINKYPLHWHKDVTQILIPLKGDIAVFVNYERVLVKEGDFYFINNGAIHSYQSENGAIVASIHIDLNALEEQFEYIKYMYFRNNMYADGYEKIDSSNYDDKFRKAAKDQFITLLINLLKDYLDHNGPTPKMQYTVEYQLAHSMVYDFNWLQFLKKDGYQLSPYKLDRYHRIIKYIHDNYKDKISLDDVSKVEYISKNYLSHFWKNISFFSFNERINFERVVMSEKLLLTTDMSISDIAYECGFSDAKYYYSHFKRWYGTTPQKHRRRCLAYMGEGMSYDPLNNSGVVKVLETYIEKHSIILKSKQDFNYLNYKAIKYLYSFKHNYKEGMDRNIVLNIFDYSELEEDNESLRFNWNIIDSVVRLTTDESYNLSIKIDCNYLDKPWFINEFDNMLKFCIFRYGENDVNKWEFNICYRGEQLLEKQAKLEETINSRVKSPRVRYYLEI